MAWFTTNSALSKVRDSQHFKTKQVEKQCETPGNSEKYQETVWNRVKQSQTETLLVSSCCHKHLTFIYTTLHNILHQDFYPSWEIFTWALLAPLASFCISALHWSGCCWWGPKNHWRLSQIQVVIAYIYISKPQWKMTNVEQGKDPSTLWKIFSSWASYKH